MAKLKIYCVNRNVTKPLEVITIKSKHMDNIYNGLKTLEHCRELIKISRDNYKLLFIAPYPYAHLLSANIIFDDDYSRYSKKEVNKIKLEIHTFAGSDYREEAIFKNCQMKIEYVDIENVDLPEEYTEHLRIHKKHLKGE